MKFIFWILAIAFVACSIDKKEKPSSDFLAGEIVGELTSNKLVEASGLAMSQANPGYLWTVNDGDNGAEVFLVDKKMNIKLTCKLSGIVNRDWEDVAIGYDPETQKNYIHVAEIGDNNAKYLYKIIYRFEEPIMADSNVLTINPEQIQQIVFRFPEGAKDSEALMIDPLTHDIFILSKREMPVHVYSLTYPQSTRDTVVAQIVTTLPFTQATAASFSLDGSEVLIKNYYCHPTKNKIK